MQYLCVRSCQPLRLCRRCRLYQAEWRALAPTQGCVRAHQGFVGDGVAWVWRMANGFSREAELASHMPQLACKVRLFWRFMSPLARPARFGECVRLYFSEKSLNIAAHAMSLPVILLYCSFPRDGTVCLSCLLARMTRLRWLARLHALSLAAHSRFWATRLFRVGVAPPRCISLVGSSAWSAALWAPTAAGHFNCNDVGQAGTLQHQGRWPVVG